MQMMSQINETQLMRENLQRMLKNENYFSSFFQKSQQQEQQSEPANPFRKKMFDKKLRRSTVSCGHYNSISPHHQSKVQESNNDNHNSQLISNMPVMKISLNTHQLLSQHQHQLPDSPLQIQKTQKMKLAQSRQSNDPNKQKITQIINNFRHELDYLEEKLHAKVDMLYQKYQRQQQQHDQSCSQDGEMEFMMQSLERIVGFMVENCVNLEDAVVCGGSGDVRKVDRQQQQVDEEEDQQQTQHLLNPITMKRQVYEIHDDDHYEQQQSPQSKENISFGDIQPHLNYKLAPHKRTHAFKQRPIGEQNNINMPNTFFVNDKLHASSQKPKHLSNINSHKIHSRQQAMKSRREQHDKPTNRHPSKHHNRKEKQFHSHKDTNSSANNSNYNSCGVESQPLPTKSIYQSVLQQREMRMKMKKRIM